MVIYCWWGWKPSFYFHIFFFGLFWMLFFKRMVWEKAAESTGALKGARSRAHLLSKCLTELPRMKIMGCEQLKSLNTARCDFLNQLPAVCSRIIHFINLSLKVSTPNRDLRLLLPSNFTEIRSGIKSTRNRASVEVQLYFRKFGSQVLGRWSISLESLAEWLPALSLSGDRGDGGRK